MAEVLARNWMAKHAPQRTDIEFSSAGLAAFPGSYASSQAIQVMSSAGIDLKDHRARMLRADLIEGCDLILTMTSGHKCVITESYPEAAAKVFTLAEYANDSGRDISDPFAQSVEVYRHCAGEIERLLNRALPKILQH